MKRALKWILSLFLVLALLLGAAWFFSALPAGNCHWDPNRMGQPRSGVRPLFQGHPVLRLGLPAVGAGPGACHRPGRCLQSSRKLHQSGSIPWPTPLPQALPPCLRSPVSDLCSPEQAPGRSLYAGPGGGPRRQGGAGCTASRPLPPAAWPPGFYSQYMNVTISGQGKLYLGMGGGIPLHCHPLRGSHFSGIGRNLHSGGGCRGKWVGQSFCPYLATPSPAWWSQ